jgi:hypothetical protein
MEPQPHDFRRMSVEEFDTGKLLAHASKQTKDRGYQKFPIVDVDSHHYENESMPEILEYLDDPVLKQLALANARPSAQKCAHPQHHGVLPGHGWPHPALWAAQPGEDAARQAPARRRADQALDGCGRRRRRGAVPDPDAGTWRASVTPSRSRSRFRAPITAGSANGCSRMSRGFARCSIFPSTIRTRPIISVREGVRREEGGSGIPHHLNALPAGACQPIHEDLRAPARNGAAHRVSWILSLARSGTRCAQSLHLGSCAFQNGSRSSR